ncbi:MAG: 30S ribosomal protein S13, partial [Nanoarchaeota archaeon]
VQSEPNPDVPSRKASASEFRNLVRIIDVDVPGEVSIFMALTRVTGVSFMLANAISNVLKLDRAEKCGNFSPQEIEKIEDVMKNPAKYNLPIWLMNRRKDRETGENKHLVGSDLDFSKNMDIRFLKKIKVYRGIRHAKGSKKVRGQKTGSSGRKGRSIGVAKKKEVKTAK